MFRSTRYVYAQAIDDTTGRVSQCRAENLDEYAAGAVTGKPKHERARAIGKAIGEKLIALKIEAVVFDRNGRHIFITVTGRRSLMALVTQV